MNSKKHSVSSGARFFLRELTIMILLSSLHNDDYLNNDDDEDTIAVNLNWVGQMNFYNN